jgi:hypothetical protein
METELIPLINSVLQQYPVVGAVGAIGLFLSGFIKIFKNPWLQDLLPYKLQWANWKSWVKFVFVLVVSLGGTILSAIALSAPIAPAVVLGLVGAFTAMGVKGASNALLKPQNHDPRASLAPKIMGPPDR